MASCIPAVLCCTCGASSLVLCSLFQRRLCSLPSVHLLLGSCLLLRGSLIGLKKLRMAIMPVLNSSMPLSFDGWMEDVEGGEKPKLTVMTISEYAPAVPGSTAYASSAGRVPSCIVETFVTYAASASLNSVESGEDEARRLVLKPRRFH